VRSKFQSHDVATTGEFMVEVTGPDGLAHHVGPFKSRQEAEDWIAQNPSALSPQLAPTAENLSHLNRWRRRTVD